RTHVPLCLFNHLTGLECPGCGAIRAVHALLAGDPLFALRNNPLVTTAIPLASIALAAWAVRRARGLRALLMRSIRVLLGLPGGAVVFAVLRNLRMFWFLAPLSDDGGRPAADIRAAPAPRDPGLLQEACVTTTGTVLHEIIVG